MRCKSLFLATFLLPVSFVQAAVTANLVAYWDFEGSANNHAAGSGGAAFNGILTGGATTTGTAKAGSGALGLDGVNDFMNVTTNVTANAAWSVSAWFRSDIVPTGTGRHFVYESSGGGNGYTMSFGLRDGTTGVPAGSAAQTSFQVFSYYNATAVNAQTLVDDAAVANTWYHTLSVFTPATPTTTGSIVSYLGGSQVSSITLPVGAVMEPVTGFRVGTYRSANGRWFDGSIDEVAIWNRSLTPAEAAEVFTLGNNGQAIPEPSAIVLAGIGLLGLMTRRR